MLNGNVKIFEYLIFRCNNLDKLIVYLVGIEVVKSYPLYTVDFAELTKKLSKSAFSIALFSVAGNILRYDDKLLDACISKALCLCNNVFKSS